MSTAEDVEVIARQMATPSAVQSAQTHLRMQLVEGWQIPKGAKILEIGCGQGDMTAVLAYAVGNNGHVTAVDSASPEYGAPVTLGQAAEHLKATSLGAQIEFYFQYDLMDPAKSFPANAFDYVVLAHCSWYFASLDQLRQTLLRIRPWTSRLCYSEWEMQPHALDQVAHLLSILIQGQIEAYKAESASNVRTPFSRTRLKQLFEETGWNPTTEFMVDSTRLEDARWEIEICLGSCLAEAKSLDLPKKSQEFLGSQVDTLRELAGKGTKRSLASYSIVADKNYAIE